MRNRNQPANASVRPVLEWPPGAVNSHSGRPGAPQASAVSALHRDAFRHPEAAVEPGASIGKGTRVWAFAHVLPGAIVGEDCNICDHTFIEGEVRIGNRVTIKCGVFLWDGITIEDDVFIGPAATFTNDYRPRSKRYPKEFLTTTLKRGCTLGANCTILPGLTIGEWAMVGAGSVVTHSVPDHALVAGNPARIRGWVCRCGQKLASDHHGRLICQCGLSYKQISIHQLAGTLAHARRLIRHRRSAASLSHLQQRLASAYARQ
jgi:acetyltransferase-like isoleucine patch superfamily enzyme